MPTKKGVFSHIVVHRKKGLGEGRKRPRITRVNKLHHRNTPHYMTTSNGKSSINSRTGRK